MGFDLVVVDHSEATVDVLRLERDEVVIGRSRDCDVVLRADNIARRHVVLRLEGPERLVVISHAPSRGGVIIDGAMLLASLAVDPAREHRLELYGFTVHVTHDVDATVARVRAALEAVFARATRIWREAEMIAAAHGSVTTLPAADAVVVAVGYGWQDGTVVLFQVTEMVRGGPRVGAQLAVQLSLPQHVLVGLRLGAPKAVLEGFPALARTVFKSPWLLHLRRPPTPGDPWLPADPVLGVIPTRPDLLARARA